jgi:hypothetical protein
LVFNALDFAVGGLRSKRPFRPFSATPLLFAGSMRSRVRPATKQARSLRSRIECFSNLYSNSSEPIIIELYCLRPKTVSRLSDATYTFPLTMTGARNAPKACCHFPTGASNRCGLVRSSASKARRRRSVSLLGSGGAGTLVITQTTPDLMSRIREVRSARSRNFPS